MNKHKNKDLVAGRLSENSPPEQESDQPAAKANTSYGRRRLGLTLFGYSRGDPSTFGRRLPEQQNTAGPSELSAADRPEGHAAETETAPHDESEQLAAETGLWGTLQTLAAGLVGFYKENTRPTLVVGGAFAVLVCVLVLMWGSSDGKTVTPSPAAAADMAAAKARPQPDPANSKATAEPQRPKRRRPKRPRPATQQASVQPPRRGPGMAARTQPVRPDLPANRSRVTIPPKPTARPKRPRTFIACPAGIHCSGIVRVSGQRLANINGAFVGIGDKIGDAKVVAIEDTCVVMKLKGRYFQLGVGTSGTGSAPTATGKEETDEDDAEEGSSDSQGP